MADLLKGRISHDAFTQKLTSQHLWLRFKPLVGYMTQDDGMLFPDDSVEGKARINLNDLISYYYDHANGFVCKASIEKWWSL